MKYGWNHALTGQRYERFNTAHARYRQANAQLIAHASLEPQHRILDFAAGTGRTAEAAMPMLGPRGRVVCVEPASAMRELGESRIRDARVHWRANLPRAGKFDRVLCGAALWQAPHLEETIRSLKELLVDSGALVFTAPALYFGGSDEPGGGADPLLHDFLVEVASGRVSTADPTPPLPGREVLESILGRAERWCFRFRFSQACLRDWWKIPVIGDALLGDLNAHARDRWIDRAYAHCDPHSWKWETWFGWVWK